MKQSSEDKYFLSLAGEYAVCSEFAKRHIPASITYGNFKAVDIIVKGQNKAFTIEVKTSMKSRVVTGFFQKYHTEEAPHPDFWVIVHIDENTLQAQFYVLSHKELGEIQRKRNNMSTWQKVDGVDNVLLSHIEEYKGRWDSIKNKLV